jgi:rhodanese-related sulfurtransferase
MEASDRRLRIGPAEAKKMVDAGEAIVLDVVESNTWRQMDVAIKDALRIDPEEVDDRLQELPTDRGIIAYCT